MKKIFTMLSVALSTIAVAQTNAPGITVSPLGTDGSTPITVTLTLADVCIPAGRDMDATWSTIAFHSGGIIGDQAWQNVVEWNSPNRLVFNRVTDGVFTATFTPDTYYGADVDGFSFVFNGYPNTAGDWDAEAKAYDAEQNCADFLYYFADEPASIGKNEMVAVKAFPNPATEMVNFEIDANDFTISLFDLSGKVVATSTTASINISELNAGAYIYKVATEKGMATGKVTKK